MAKKKNVSEQPKAEAAAPVVEGNLKEEAKEQKVPKSGIITTEGNMIDRIRVFQDTKNPKITMVQVDYGKYNPEGKNMKERRANMRVMYAHALTPEQAKEYQRLSNEDPSKEKLKAKEFAVRAAYPMHVDDAAFHQKNAEINGRKVDYIYVEPITEESVLLNSLNKGHAGVYNLSKEQKADLIATMAPEQKAAVLESNKDIIGKLQLSFGEKGKPETRFYGIMTKEERQSLKVRAEVTLDEKGEVKSIGAPITLAQIAERFENRVKSEREAKAAKLESAQYDWASFKFTDAVKASFSNKLHYAPSPDPSRVYVEVNVNGINVKSQLTEKQTTALRNKMATLDQVAAANFDFRDKVKGILGTDQVIEPRNVQEQAETKGIDKQAVVDVIVARTSSQSAKSFTDDQVKALNDYAEAAGARDPETREQIFEDLWKTAEPSLKGVNEKWQEDARAELKDLAQGNVRAEQQGMHR